MDAKWWQKLTLPLARWAKKNLNKYTELFRNIASYEIMHVDSFQIGDIRKTVKLPKMALTAFLVQFAHCLCESSLGFFLLHMWCVHHVIFTNYLWRGTFPGRTYHTFLITIIFRFLYIVYYLNLGCSVLVCQKKIIDMKVKGHFLDLFLSGVILKIGL